MYNPLAQIKAPAIGLIVAGALNIIYGLYVVGSSILQIQQGVLNQSFANEANKTGFYVGFLGVTGLAIVNLVLAPIIIAGAVSMMNSKRYGLAKTAAIIAVIPFVSCCLLVGIPFGIWALIVLGKPEVKAAFNGDLPNQQNFNPPPPQGF